MEAVSQLDLFLHLEGPSFPEHREIVGVKIDPP